MYHWAMLLQRTPEEHGTWGCWRWTPVNYWTLAIELLFYLERAERLVLEQFRHAKGLLLRARFSPCSSARMSATDSKSKPWLRHIKGHPIRCHSLKWPRTSLTLSLLPSLRVLKRGYDVDINKANKSMTAIIQQPSRQLKARDPRGNFRGQSWRSPWPTSTVSCYFMLLLWPWVEERSQEHNSTDWTQELWSKW